MCGVTRKDRVRNEYIPGSLGIALIQDKLKASRLRYIWYVMKSGSQELIFKKIYEWKYRRNVAKDDSDKEGYEKNVMLHGI